MGYDTWVTGGSDPGYDPMDPRDEYEPESNDQAEAASESMRSRKAEQCHGCGRFHVPPACGNSTVWN